MPGRFVRTVRSMGLAVSLFALASGTGEAASPAAGVVISNTVTAQYSDPQGLSYGVQSNTISVSIAAIAPSSAPSRLASRPLATPSSA